MLEGRCSSGLVCSIALSSIPAAALALVEPVTAAAVTEFVTLTHASGPDLIAAGPDGNVWFTENKVGQVGRITPLGAINEFRLSTATSAPSGISVGPDGNLWAAEAAANKVARITPSGAVTEFPLAAGSKPAAIAAGGDGALWFAESGTNRIGRITTGGTVTQFTVPTALGAPNSIAAGPDGALWFIEGHANKVGRITTGGSASEFSIPTAASASTGITAGPDGALWFVESAKGKVGRVTTGGAFKEFTTSANGPRSIVAGPEGALWFTDFGANRIGRITTTGTVTEFAVPTGASQPTGIATGPDGNLWFTEQATSRLGRLADAVSSTSYVLDTAAGFAPKSRETAQGAHVEWIFTGPRSSGVADTSGLSLFGSGPRSSVTYYAFVVTAAGSYGYDDPLATAHTGSLTVAETAAPASGTTATTFTITFASAVPASPVVIDAQLAFCATLPCTPSYAAWTTATGTSQRSQAFGSGDAQFHGAGHYFFRSRLRNSGSGKATGYSPAASLTVSGASSSVSIDTGGSNGCTSPMFCFDPPMDNASSGTAVKWTNTTGADHTVTRCTPSACSGADGGTGPDHGPGSGTVGPGQTYSFTFSGAGTYLYYCAVHGYATMHGTIVVTASTRIGALLSAHRMGAH